VLAVGHAYLAGTPLAKVAQTALDNLGKALGESCSAATLDGDNVLYIARAAVNNLLSIDLGRGSRLPAWATSMGRVLLSALPEEQLEVTLSRARLFATLRIPCAICPVYGRDRPGAHAGLCPRRPAD
jgi:IclR family pca regulon transcriptional regulator